MDELRPKVESLIIDPSEVNLKPLVEDVEEVEKKSDALNEEADQMIISSNRTAADANDKREMMLEVEKLVHEAARKARDTVAELEQLAEGLIGSVGPNADRLIAEAERILEELEERGFSEQNEEANEEKEKAELLSHNIFGNIFVNILTYKETIFNTEYKFLFCSECSFYTQRYFTSYIYHVTQTVH